MELRGGVDVLAEPIIIASYVLSSSAGGVEEKGSMLMLPRGGEAERRRELIRSAIAWVEPLAEA